MSMQNSTDGRKQTYNWLGAKVGGGVFTGKCAVGLTALVGILALSIVGYVKFLLL